jgi:hypothetical protein
VGRHGDLMSLFAMPILQISHKTTVAGQMDLDQELTCSVIVNPTPGMVRPSSEPSGDSR